MNDNDKAKEKETMICRCEEITLDEIKAVIEKGITDFNEIKNILRVGMGPCQGRTCRSLILNEIARALNKTEDEISVPTYRPPSKPVKISIIVKGGEYEK